MGEGWSEGFYGAPLTPSPYPLPQGEENTQITDENMK